MGAFLHYLIEQVGHASGRRCRSGAADFPLDVHMRADASVRVPDWGCAHQAGFPNLSASREKLGFECGGYATLADVLGPDMRVRASQSLYCP